MMGLLYDWYHCGLNYIFSFSLLRMILVFFTFESFLGPHIPGLEFLKFLAFSVLVSYKRVSYKKKSVMSPYIWRHIDPWSKLL